MGEPPEATPGATGPDDAESNVPSLLAWALAAFHAALLVALVVGALFFSGLAGNQLAALDTSVGVVAYGYLWAVTWFTNRRMLATVGPGLVAGSAAPTDVSVAAMRWGGLAGVLVFLPALVVGVVLFVGAGGLEALPFILLAAAVGVVVSVGVGAIVGLTFGLLALLLVRAARAWLPPRTSFPADRGRRTAE